jgi:glycosyltransferase involved in cell wall biosynthesis
MACGVPVLTSATSSMPEVAGDAALLVNPFNYKEISGGMEGLLQDERLRACLKERGLQRAKLFTWSASAEKLLSIYERFASKH